MRIIFMGTPYFAVPSLDILYTAGYDIVAVITASDKMGGRGRKTLIESAVKKYAVSKGLNILQPKNLKSAKFNETLRNLKADLQIVVAFRMLPEVVWNMPPMGTYNLHGSLLPAYRGAAPINWAVINGETQTGVTTFKLKHEIDTGAICLQKLIPIYAFDNAGAVHDRMIWVGADAVLDTVVKIEGGDITLLPQDDAKQSHAPKLHKENTEINFQQSAKEIYDFIRGLSPYPTAWMTIDGKSSKVYEASYRLLKHSLSTNTIMTDGKSKLSVACKDGLIDIHQLQLSGKRRMGTKELLNGYTISEAVPYPDFI